MGMKVVLMEDVDDVGRVGDVVTVKGGFGRNYLIPQGKAAPATKANLASVAARRKVHEAESAKARSESEAIAARIAALSVSITRKVGEADTLYGSVTSADIASALAARGVVVDKRRIHLNEPLKALGEFRVPIRLHGDVTAELRVSVERG